MPDINRRTFVTTGAVLLATGTSMLLPREANAATHDTAHDPTRESDALLQPTLPHTSGKAISMDEHHLTEDMTRCIQLCQDCHTLCVQMISHCVNLGGRYAAPEHIRLLMDCAQMCTTTAEYMARESVFHDRLCGLCAEMCRLCAESCERTAGDDQMMKQCAGECRRCAESCERMSSKRAV